jgi:hypothetical protein
MSGGVWWGGPDVTRLGMLGVGWNIIIQAGLNWNELE